MIQWGPIIRELNQEWEILVKRKGSNISGAPKISKAIPIIKLTGYFANFIHRTVGERKTPLFYVIRELDTVPGVALSMLDKFISFHRKLYVMMTQCTKHVDYQLPNKSTCANFLLDAIKFKDPGLNAAIEMEKGDKGPTRKMNKLKKSSIT